MHPTRGVFDFHTHTFLSDGELAPIELIRRAIANGYEAIAVTDHVGINDQERVLEILVRECELASREMGIVAVPGVELTHVPPHLIDEAAQKAKRLGAQIVIVHGETIKEPVAPGTNQAAVSSAYVDVLAHPGMITERDVQRAKERGVFLELSAREGHAFTNGHVARAAVASGTPLVVNSDTHAPQDLLTASLAHLVACGAGLDESEALKALGTNPLALLKKLHRLPLAR